MARRDLGKADLAGKGGDLPLVFGIAIGVRMRAPSKCSTEPPPAATVWISIIGARMRTPATSVSKLRSYSPEKCDTSVEVPPMSKPMTFSKPARRAVSAMPTTPPGRTR